MNRSEFSMNRQTPFTNLYLDKTGLRQYGISREGATVRAKLPYNQTYRGHGARSTCSGGGAWHRW